MRTGETAEPQILVLEDRDGGDWVLCRQSHFDALERRAQELEAKAREVLVWLPDNLPSNELYAAVDNLAALIPPALPDAGGPR